MLLNKLSFFQGNYKNINDVPVGALDTGWKLGGTAENIAYGIIPWINPENVLVDSTSAAYNVDGGSFDYTDKLRVTNFNFSAIPDGATITGIMAKYRRRCSSPNDYTDDIVQLVLSGSAIGEDKSTLDYWASSNETPEYGTSTDLWTLTPTVANIKDSTFGIEIAGVDIETGTDDVYIEAVWLKIFYTA